MERRASYPTDVTDEQWSRLEPLIPAPKPGGRPPTYGRREIVNAVLYQLRGGAAWRMMPHDLPPWGITYHINDNYFLTLCGRGAPTAAGRAKPARAARGFLRFEIRESSPELWKCGNLACSWRDFQGARGKGGKPAVGIPGFPQPRHFHNAHVVAEREF